MTLLLRWRMPDPPITLMWRGADQTIAQQAAANPAVPVAVIIGPVGPAGPSFDLDNAVIDGGTFN